MKRYRRHEVRRSSVDRSSRFGFVIPFALGTLLGAVGGATIGALLGHRLFGGLLHLWSMLHREHDEELRFDLFLQ